MKNKSLLALCAVFLTLQVFSYDIGTKLKDLKIPYETLEQDIPFVIATMGDARILISKDGIRNQDNEVVRAVMQAFGPLILTEEHIEKLIKVNTGKTEAEGIWGVWGLEEQHQVIYYEIDIPENATDEELTKTIIKCSKIQIPFYYDMKAQYSSAIRKVLDLDSNAGHASSREETVRRMRQINLDLCPVDFVNAYRRHLAAWEKSLDMSTTKAGVELGAVIGSDGGQDPAGAVAGALIFGLLGGVIESSLQSEDISSTWDEVKRVARLYGVNI